MTIIETAKCILKEGPICDCCMGRQFGKLSTGLTNAQRGIRDQDRHVHAGCGGR